MLYVRKLFIMSLEQNNVFGQLFSKVIINQL